MLPVGIGVGVGSEVTEVFLSWCICSSSPSGCCSEDLLEDFDDWEPITKSGFIPLCKHWKTRPV